MIKQRVQLDDVVEVDVDVEVVVEVEVLVNGQWPAAVKKLIALLNKVAAAAAATATATAAGSC